MKRVTAFVIVVVALAAVLAACSSGPSQEQIQQTVEAASAATIAARPTEVPTVTPIPLSDLDLEPIIIQDGDLPAKFSGQQITSVAPKQFKSMPQAVQVINRGFIADGYASDGTTVWLYSSSTDAKAAFEKAVEALSGKNVPLENIGEIAMLSNQDTDFLGTPLVTTEVVFARCNAVAHVSLFGYQDSIPDITTAYADRIDKRLSKLLCPD